MTVYCTPHILYHNSLWMHSVFSLAILSQRLVRTFHTDNLVLNWLYLIRAQFVYIDTASHSKSILTLTTYQLCVNLTRSPFGVSLSQNRLVCSFSNFSFIDPHFMQWHFHDLWFIYVIVLYIYVIVSRLIGVRNINKYQLPRIENICTIILIYLYRMALGAKPIHCFRLTSS